MCCACFGHARVGARGEQMLRERLAQREQRIAALKAELAAANARAPEAGRASATTGHSLPPPMRSIHLHAALPAALGSMPAAAPRLHVQPRSASNQAGPMPSSQDVPGHPLDTAVQSFRDDSTPLEPAAAAAADGAMGMPAGPAEGQDSAAEQGQAARGAIMVTNPLATQEAEAFPPAAAADDNATVRELCEELADVRFTLAQREAEVEALQAALSEAIGGHAQAADTRLVRHAGPSFRSSTRCHDGLC